MNGTGYTPKQVWMDYTASSLKDASGNDASNDTIFKGGSWVTCQGESVNAIRYKGTLYEKGPNVRVPGKGHASTTLYKKDGTAVQAIEYRGTLYELGSIVSTTGTSHRYETLYEEGKSSARTCGDKLTYTRSTASPRLYSASKATSVTLELAKLKTVSTGVLRT